MTTLSASLERYQRDKFNDIKEGHNGDLMSRPNMLGLTCLLDDSCGTLRSPLVTFLAVVEFILSKSFQRYRQCHYQSFDVPLRFLLLFVCSLSPLSSLLLVICEERGERKNIENTSKFRWQHHQHCWKNLDETNPAISKKVTNGDRSAPQEPSEEKWALIHLYISCGILWSLFLAFLGVIAFFLLISFQRYRWCRHQSFGVFPGFFYFFPCFFLSPFFLL